MAAAGCGLAAGGGGASGQSPAGSDDDPPAVGVEGNGESSPGRPDPGTGATEPPLDTDAQSGSSAELDPPPGQDCLQLADPRDAVHAEFFELLNAYRIENGRAPLEYSAALEAGADAHARDMYERNYIGHTSPDGKQPADWAVQAGFCHDFIGENIAWGRDAQDTPQEAMEGLIGSSPHDANMLSERYGYVGVGYFHASTPQGEEYRWVQLFAVDLAGELAGTQQR